MVDYLKTSKELDPDYNVKVFVNNELLMEKHMTKASIFEKEGKFEIDGSKLKDGANEIALDNAGNLTGVESLPAESRIAVKSALEGEKLNRPDVLDDLATAQVAVRGPNGDEEPMKIVYPGNAVIAEAQPTLLARH